MVAGGRHDPAAGVGWQAIARPLAQGDGEGHLHRVLGEVEVTEDADEDRYRAAPLLAEQGLDC
jgi:hypothetical protein